MKAIFIAVFLFGTSIVASPIPNIATPFPEWIASRVRDPSAISIRRALPPGGVAGNADIEDRGSEQRAPTINGGVVGNAVTKGHTAEKRVVSQVGGVVGNAGLVGITEEDASEKRNPQHADGLPLIR